MAKDKVEVPSIQIGREKPGFAFGGVIYSASSTIGYNGSPTVVNVNVALDSQYSKTEGGDREFKISNANLNLASPIEIKFAGHPLFRNMFLKGYSDNTSVGNKILSLDYTDGSALLDRIFVGIIHEHYQIIPSKHSVPNMIEMDVFCPVIETHNINRSGAKGVTFRTCSANGYKAVTRRTFRALANASGDALKPYKVIRQDSNNVWAGGWIVLGQEEFTETKCSLSDVSYSFEDLVKSVRSFGIAIDLSRFPNRKNNRHFTRNYSGTLKDVLQNWGNDLGISFFWNFAEIRPTLSVVDLTDRSIQAKFETALSGIDSLDKGHGADMISGSNIIINSKNHSKTLDGTYSQAFSSVFQRGPGANEQTSEKVSQVYFVCQTLKSIATGGGKILGRNLKDFLISIMLNKFAPELRDIYNIRRAIQVYKKAPGSAIKKFDAAAGYFNALGFTQGLGITFGGDINAELQRSIVSQAGIHQMIKTGLDAQTKSQNGKVVGPNGADYEMFFGVKDDTVRDYVKGVETAIADQFYGKHYTLSAPASEYFTCNEAYKILENITVEPSATFYGAAQHYKTPMAKFAQGISNLKIEALESSGLIFRNYLYDQANKLREQIKVNCSNDAFNAKNRSHGFFHFERNAAWFASREEVERVLNPWTLSRLNPLQYGEPAIDGLRTELFARPQDVSRYKQNIVSDYAPFMCEMPLSSQVVDRFKGDAAVAYDVMERQKATGKEVGICLVLKNKDGNFPAARIGDVGISFGDGRNLIEEMNALAAMCDRQQDVSATDTDQCKTVCEGDLAQELCSSNILGLSSLSCGEAEAIKDSLYPREIMGDGNEQIWAKRLVITRYNSRVDAGVKRSERHYYYADTITGKQDNKNGSSDTIITAPTEQDHGGVARWKRQMTRTNLGIRKVYDGLDNKKSIPYISPKVSSIKYVTQDISQDVSTVFTPEGAERIVKGELPIDIINDQGFEVVKDDLTELEYKTLTKSPAQKYHELLRNNISALQVDTVRESVSYKIYIDSKEGLGLLSRYLRQENGLESVSIGNDESGYFITVNFSNRPPVVPELEAIYRKVGPISKSVQPKNSFYRSMQ